MKSFKIPSLGKYSVLSMSDTLKYTGTFEEGCDVPSRDPSLLHELPQCNLQEEDWDASDEHNEQVGDQENSCNTRDAFAVQVRSLVIDHGKMDPTLLFYV